LARCSTRNTGDCELSCGADGGAFTQKMVQNVMKRVAGTAKLRHGVHILRHTFW
jgi:hypothetical protein